VTYYQSTHFNRHVSINGIQVGGLNKHDVIHKLKNVHLKNDIYIGEERIFNGADTETGFSSEDLPEIEKLLNKQKTWWPSSKENHFTVLPAKADQNRIQTLRKQAETKLNSLNKKRQAPVDAAASLVNGRVIITKSKKGNQFDVEKMLDSFDKKSSHSDIHLEPVYLQPLAEDSPTVKKEMKSLQELLQRTVVYQVQNKKYPLPAKTLIRNASVTKDLKVKVDPEPLRAKIGEINRSQSTLHKNFPFRTHSGKNITVKGQSYGWTIDVDKESARLKKAFETGEKSLRAYYVYGVGYSTYGIGYHTTENNGIGYTYAEVSIEDQRIWIYKNGKMVLTTHVVTGRHDTREDTPKGLWYIMYKESPSTLEGSEAGNPNYSVKVSYWAPFTMSGCGFHDAGWRKNWAKDAYIHNGSGGCVNTPPAVMKTVYENLEQNEPVIIY
jgi:hypothetical protein